MLSTACAFSELEVLTGKNLVKLGVSQLGRRSDVIIIPMSIPPRGLVDTLLRGTKCKGGRLCVFTYLRRVAKEEWL